MKGAPGKEQAKWDFETDRVVVAVPHAMRDTRSMLHNANGFAPAPLASERLRHVVRPWPDFMAGSPLLEQVGDPSGRATDCPHRS